jgi:hypothetical protein
VGARAPKALERRLHCSSLEQSRDPCQNQGPPHRSDSSILLISRSTIHVTRDAGTA